jgi:spore protease
MALDAVELTDFAKKMGVTTSNIDGILKSRVLIRTDEQSKMLGKRKGLYYTFEADGLNHKTKKILIGAIKEVLIEMTALSINRKPTVLVVGLGNSNITADSLGTEVLDKLIVTKPLFDTQSAKCKDLTNLCAIAPGVYGLTGIETIDIIKGIAREVKPDIILAVDSLASTKTGRLYSCFQLTTAGIEPGSGVDNRRPPLNSDTLNVPVISVGVPLALYARSLLQEGLSEYSKQL